MTVKEVEERTGLPRANIRYYESEGLIHPARGENGYRDYRQEDLDTLLKIKLLRQVGFSLEEIRALQAGELDLEPALEGRLAALSAQRTELGQAAGICRAMREDHVRYDTLDAPAYLDRMNQPERPALTWREDPPPQAVFPWRRFWARTVDLTLCTFLYYGALALLGRISVLNRTGGYEILDQFGVLALLLLLEPLCLHLWGATPGKFLFGLRLTRSDGSCFSYREGLRRTALVLVGIGGNLIPLVSSGLMIAYCWQDYHGRLQFWCRGTDEVYTDGSRPGQSYWSTSKSRLKALGALGLVLGSFALGIGIQNWVLAPVNQDREMTVEQFVENYNQFSQALAGADEAVERLTVEGTFVEPEDPPGAVVISLHEEAPLRLAFQEEDGALTAVSYSYHYEPAREQLPTSLPDQETAKILWSFLYGRCSLSREELLDLMWQIEEQPDQPLEWTDEGAEILYRPEVLGYHVSDFGLIPKEGAEEYRVTAEFSVSLA